MLVAAQLPDWMRPASLTLKLRKRMEESDLGLKAALEELRRERVRSSSRARGIEARRSRLGYAVSRSLESAGDLSLPMKALRNLVSGHGLVVCGTASDAGSVLWCGRLAAADTHWNLIMDDATAFVPRGAGAVERAGEAAATAPESLLPHERGQRSVTVDAVTGLVVCGSENARSWQQRPAETAVGPACRGVCDAATQYQTGSVGKRQQVILAGRHILLLVAMPVS